MRILRKITNTLCSLLCLLTVVTVSHAEGQIVMNVGRTSPEEVPFVLTNDERDEHLFYVEIEAIGSNIQYQDLTLEIKSQHPSDEKPLISLKDKLTQFLLLYNPTQKDGEVYTY